MTGVSQVPKSRPNDRCRFTQMHGTCPGCTRSCCHLSLCYTQKNIYWCFQPTRVCGICTRDICVKNGFFHHFYKWWNKLMGWNLVRFGSFVHITDANPLVKYDVHALTTDRPVTTQLPLCKSMSVWANFVSSFLFLPHWMNFNNFNTGCLSDFLAFYY